MREQVRCVNGLNLQVNHSMNDLDFNTKPQKPYWNKEFWDKLKQEIAEKKQKVPEPQQTK